MLFLFIFFGYYIHANFVEDISRDLVRKAVADSIKEAQTQVTENIQNSIKSYTDPLAQKMEHLRSLTSLSWNDVWGNIKNSVPYHITANPGYEKGKFNPLNKMVSPFSENNDNLDVNSDTASESRNHKSHSKNQHPKNNSDSTNRAGSKPSQNIAEQKPKIFDLSW